MCSEVYQWLKSISSGLNLERLTKEFEVRGFSTQQSLMYLQKEDLDAFFPSPQKLLLAEKRILQEDINKLKEPKLPPRELFPPLQVSRQAFPAAATQSFNNISTSLLPELVATSSADLIPATQHFQTPLNGGSKPGPSQPASSSYLDKPQSQLTQDLQMMQVQLGSAKQKLHLTKRFLFSCISFFFLPSYVFYIHPIGHLWAFWLCVKTSLNAKPFIWFAPA